MRRQISCPRLEYNDPFYNYESGLVFRLDLVMSASGGCSQKSL